LSAGASPHTPLGELTALPQTTYLDLTGPTSKGERKGTGGDREAKGGYGREGEGGHPQGKPGSGPVSVQ